VRACLLAAISLIARLEEYSIAGLFCFVVVLRSYVCVVCGVWCVVCDVWCVVCDVWCVVACGVWVWEVWCVVCVVCGV
jgi:hypothetical protein